MRATGAAPGPAFLRMSALGGIAALIGGDLGVIATLWRVEDR